MIQVEDFGIIPCNREGDILGWIDTYRIFGIIVKICYEPNLFRFNQYNYLVLSEDIILHEGVQDTYAGSLTKVVKLLKYYIK